MSDLRTELDKLTDQRLDYVIARSRVNTDSQALRDAGINRSSFYSWTLEERTALNELAQRVKREVALRAVMVLQDAAEDAAQVKVSGCWVIAARHTSVASSTGGRPARSGV